MNERKKGKPYQYFPSDSLSSSDPVDASLSRAVAKNIKERIARAENAAEGRGVSEPRNHGAVFIIMSASTKAHKSRVPPANCPVLTLRMGVLFLGSPLIRHQIDNIPIRHLLIGW